MRIKVGKMVDIDSDVNLVDLKPLDRIIAAAMTSYHNTRMYQRRFAESEERKQEERRRIQESLIDSLISVIVPELERNQHLKSHGDICKAILIKVPARFKMCLTDAIHAHEFDAYDITVVPTAKVVSKFAEPPFLLYVTSRSE